MNHFMVNKFCLQTDCCKITDILAEAVKVMSTTKKIILHSVNDVTLTYQLRGLHNCFCQPINF